MKMHPEVSIFCLTYNHQDFISECIDSILAQRTNFRFVIIITDDCSTDKTAEICREYQNRFPDKIIFSSNEKNRGTNSNMFLTFERCLKTKSKYIAQIGGDDYWTDPYKLQKQYDFIEVHPEVAFCYTNAYSICESNNTDKEIIIKEKPGKNIFDLRYYIENNCFIIPAQTVFFRSSVYPDPVPGFLYNAFHSDWALNILFLQKGKAAYINEYTAVYRYHSAGITLSSELPVIIFNSIQLTKALNKYFEFKYHHVFGKVQWRYRQLVVYYFENRKYMKGILWFLFCFFRNPWATIGHGYFLKTLYKVTFTKHKV